MKTYAILAFAGALCLAGAAHAQTAAPAPAAPIQWMPGYIEPGLPRPAYVPPSTPQGTGPYQAIMATEKGAEKFGAYYPSNLKALGDKKLPVMVWANGSCAYIGNRFRHFLTEIASHGYFILAGGAIRAPDGGQTESISMSQNNALRNPEAPPTPAAAPAAAPAGPPAPRVTHELLSEGIDWAIAENNRKGSKFYQKLDTANVAVMGQSCGGGVASTFADDPRVKTIAMWSGASGTGQTLGATLNKPALIITGDARYDVAYYGGLSSFETVKKQPAFYGFRVNMTHLGTFRQANGGELAPIATAWLDWHLKGDEAAAKMFKGEDCTLCTNKSWHIQKRNID